MDGDSYIHVYTDGSAQKNGQTDARAGLGVYWGDRNWYNVSERVVGRQTNNSGEIQAAIRAMEVALDLGFEQIHIFTDSRFLINAASNWIGLWKRRNWTVASGGPVLNKQDFQRLDELLCTPNFYVRWSHVSAHVGIPGNEAADKLAKAGSLCES
jgi:ribonuclease HI